MQAGTSLRTLIMKMCLRAVLALKTNSVNDEIPRSETVQKHTPGKIRKTLVGKLSKL